MIRYLTDENEIVKLFPLFIAEGRANGEDVTKLVPEDLWNAIKACMDYGAVIVDEESLEITGCMCIALVKKYWCADTLLTNLMYFVTPKYRNSKIGAKLLDEALSYANKVNLDFKLSVESYEDLDRKDKFFQRKNLIKCGGNYILKGANYAYLDNKWNN